MKLNKIFVLFFFFIIFNSLSFSETVYLTDNSVVNCPTENGLFTGIGTHVFSDGSRYEGEFSHGLYNGKGKLSCPKYVYDGEFQNGSMTGLGRIVYADGEEYNGEFRDSMYNGNGKCVDAQGNVYAGNFIDGYLEGKGSIRLANGDSYSGTFSKGRLQGKGVFRNAAGDYYEGLFTDNHFDGEGKLTMSNGKEYKGVFVNGKLPAKYNKTKTGFIYKIIFALSIILNIIFLIQRRKDRV